MGIISTLPLRLTLTRKGWSVLRLADETGISPTTLYKFTGNNAKAIRFDNLAAICDALECQVEDVFKVEQGEP